MINYTFTTEGISPEQLKGFFDGWPNPPSPETHLRLLKNSDEIVLAIDAETKRIVGFITAITDHVLSAYIPLLEVLPEYRGRGIGSELVDSMLERLGDLYMIDLICDQELQAFYAKRGMVEARGMMMRNYDSQSGAAERFTRLTLPARGEQHADTSKPIEEGLPCQRARSQY